MEALAGLEIHKDWDAPDWVGRSIGLPRGKSLVR